LAKQKNLSKEDLEDVSTFGDFARKKISLQPDKISIQSIPIKVKCLNEKQKDLKKAIEEKDVVIANGFPGSGKTYISLLTALHLLKTEPKYERLVLIKSLQVIKGEEVGFLPGSLDEKIEPYMYSFTSNLDKILSKPINKSLRGQGIIEIFPIAYLRGTTQDSCIVIIDETQNIDLHTFKTIITRIGSNCKMIFLGDADQIDRKKSESCLLRVSQLFKDVDFVGSVTFTETDSVRNPLIPKLLDILRKEDKE